MIYIIKKFNKTFLKMYVTEINAMIKTVLSQQNIIY